MGRLGRGSSGSSCSGGRGKNVAEEVVVVAEDQGEEQVPAWLEGLMGETFFTGCGVHEDSKKNEKNIFCLSCCLSICHHCLPSHCSHPLLQVRRYVYQDVVRLDDVQKLIDCSYIQPYTINGAKVIFLNERAQSRPCKGSANLCFTCERILQPPFHFCSLSCKVDHLVNQGDQLSGILYRIQESDFAYTQFEGDANFEPDVDDDAQIIENSIMEEEGHLPLRSTMGSSEISTSSGPPESTKKKKKGYMSGIFSFNSGRRKGAPQRSPLS
ncbi:hypothetical protein Ancab_021674 [Ancistrocladus abbreviatus]